MLKSSQGVMMTFVKKLSKKLMRIENSTLKSYRKIYVEKLSKKLIEESKILYWRIIEELS